MKSALLAPEMTMEFSVAGAPPVFISITGFDELGVFTGCELNITDGGENERADAEAVKLLGGELGSG